MRRNEYALFSLTQTATRFIVGITTNVESGDVPDDTKQIVDDLIAYASLGVLSFILLTPSSWLQGTQSNRRHHKKKTIPTRKSERLYAPSR